MHSVFSRNKLWMFFAFIFLAGVFSISLYSVSVYANVYNLYSTSCLGGWKNTHLASGAPEASMSDISTFSESNSSLLEENIQTQIFCGDFSGDILEGTIPQKILVKFSWIAAYPDQDDSTEEGEETEESAEEDATENSEEENAEEDVTEGEAGDGAEEGTTSDEGVVEEDTEDNIEDEQTQTEPIPAEETPVPTEPVSPSEPTAPAEPVVFSRDLFGKFVFAQEIEETGEIETEEGITTPTGQTEEDTGADEDVAEESLPEEDENTEDADEGVPIPEASYGLVEVLYTLNGVDWKSLGFVKENEFSNKNFEIPIEEASQWEDVSKIQIGVKSLPTLDGVLPVIFLDAVWLEAEYKYAEEESEETIEEELPEEEITEEEMEEEILEEEQEGPVLGEGAGESQSLPEFISKENLGEIIPERVLKNVILNHFASHSCRAENFNLSFGEEMEIYETFNLFGNLGSEGRLIVGSLPKGIDARFVENNSYELKTTNLTKSTKVKFIRGRGAQKGSFNISLIYQLNSPMPSNVLCQVNLVN